ncbi:helix-turn-helix transcriptional regulator [Ornithinicoccus halotolerans]|uniref:helix-turn-helix transcriptional regulator n=1 Tax=Ornithinicoccus halotolerans TaxID=1748220 RepID=UPI001885C12F|nr:helix-turn-helix transcriptional regulator [Ornithinicoccus halotolerans]
MTVTHAPGRSRDDRASAAGLRRSDTVAGVLHATLEHLHRLVRFDAAYISGTDPETTLYSRAVITEGVPGSSCAPIVHNEFHEHDVNKVAALHRAGPRGHVTTLHRATGGRPDRSPRARTVNRELGLGPELRATFSTARHCWGAMTLLRAEGDGDFTDAELSLVAGSSRLVTTRLREVTLRELARPAGPDQPCGVVTLDEQGRVVAMTDRAAELVDGLSMLPVADILLPAAVPRGAPGELHVVASLAQAQAQAQARAGRPGDGVVDLPEAVVRIPSPTHGWLTLRAECARDAGGTVVATHVVLEQSRPADVLAMVVACYDLSPREEEVLVEVVAGRGTDEIAARLVISPHTVRDHVKALFEKTGTRSRGELASHLFAVHYKPTLQLDHRPPRSAASGVSAVGR